MLQISRNNKQQNTGEVVNLTLAERGTLLGGQPSPNITNFENDTQFTATNMVGEHLFDVSLKLLVYGC